MIRQPIFGDHYLTLGDGSHAAAEPEAVSASVASLLWHGGAMRIAFLGSEGVPYPAAFAKITEELGSRLVERGHEVVVYGRRHAVPDAGSYRGMTRIPVGSWNTKHLDTFTFTAHSTFQLLRGGDADIAHYHGIGTSPFARLARAAGMRTVVHIHAHDWKRPKWGRFARAFLRWTEAMAVRGPHAAVAVSLGLRDELSRQYGCPVAHVPQGVDPPIMQPPALLNEFGLTPGRYLLFMGRLVPEKGLHHLIEAYRRLHTDVPLVVAGGASHSERYAADIAAAAPPGVMFLGHVSGVLKEALLSHAYLYVQPSELEGLSLALLEAMSYGNAVLVSDIAENLEAVAGHGLTFRNADVDDLSLRLSEAFDSRQRLLRLGERARNHVLQHYSWDVVVDEMERVYSELMPQRSVVRERISTP